MGKLKSGSNSLVVHTKTDSIVHVRQELTKPTRKISEEKYYFGSSNFRYEPC